MEKILDKIINHNSYFILSYFLINLGFLVSFIFKFDYFYLKLFVKYFIMFLLIFLVLESIIYYVRVNDKPICKIRGFDLLEFTNELITNKYFIIFIKKLFFILIIIFPLLYGLQIDVNPTVISIISEFLRCFGLILLYSYIIKYGYFSQDTDKRTFGSILYFVLGLLIIINIFYPNIFNDFLNLFQKNFIDLVVISLTFILMTATLALLAFTYNMILRVEICKQKFKETGSDYFIATIYIILFTIIIFLFFSLLKLFNINSWNSLFNYDPILFIKLNVICILILCLTYLFCMFLVYFVNGIIFCLGLLKIDCL